MTFVFLPPSPVTLPIAGSCALFPVRRVYCVGRNYADHAREMGAHEQAEGREPPFFFSKPADALVPVKSGADAAIVTYPTLTSNLQHEVELVVALGPELPDDGVDMDAATALDGVFGYAIGIDLTRRDIQAAAKAKGHPWDMAKGFDHSAPIGPLHAALALGHPARGSIWLEVNGERRQAGDLASMSWGVAEIIAQLSRFVQLRPGDLIYTGTPAGVGTIVRGDIMHCGIEGLGTLTARLV